MNLIKNYWTLLYLLLFTNSYSQNVIHKFNRTKYDISIDNYFAASDALYFSSWGLNKINTSTGLITNIGINGLADASKIKNYIEFNHKIIVSTSEYGGNRLLVVDETTSDYILLKNYTPEINNLYKTSNYVFFIAKTAIGINNSELWRTDGTAGGTIKLGDINNVGLDEYRVCGNNFFFKHLNKVWVSDGTLAGTHLATSALNNVEAFFDRGNKLWFSIFVGNTMQRQLWETDGTDGGTRLIKAIIPDNPASKFVPVHTLTNSNILFVYDSKLWVSNGTEMGTFILKSNIKDCNNFTNLGSYTYFSANDNITGNELWKTDGTLQNTTIVNDIRNGLGSSNPKNLITFNNKLFFTADNGIIGEELYELNTNSTISLFKEFVVGNKGAYFGYFTVVGNKMVFMSDIEDGYRGLWVTDGQLSNTIAIKNIDSNLHLRDTYPIDKVGSDYYFVGNDGNGADIWKINTSTQVVSFVNDFVTGYGNNVDDISNVTVNGNKLFYTVKDSLIGKELWVTDLVNFSSSLVYDFTKISNHFFEYNSLTDFNTDSYFNANLLYNNSIYYIINGHEIWRVNQDYTTTQLAKSTQPYSSLPCKIIVYKNKIYFLLKDEIWVSDGTVGNTQLFHTFPTYNDYSRYSKRLFDVKNNLLFFSGNSGGYNPDQLYCTDGVTKTLLSTTMTGSPIHFGSGASIFNQFVFPINNNEIWSSDGTVTNSKKIDKTFSYYYDDFIGINNMAYFSSEKSSTAYLCSTNGSNISILQSYASSTIPFKYAINNGIMYVIKNNNQFSLFQYTPLTNSSTLLSQTPNGLTRVDYQFYKDDIAYFMVSAQSSYNSPFFYRSDGTLVGSFPIILPSPYNSDSFQHDAYHLFSINNTLYFLAYYINTNKLHLFASNNNIFNEIASFDIPSNLAHSLYNDRFREFKFLAYFNGNLFLQNLAEGIDGYREILQINLCQENLTIDNTINENGIYKASVSISAMNKIEPSRNIEYNAGKSIILQNGFEAKNGAVFQANINGGCNQ